MIEFLVLFLIAAMVLLANTVIVVSTSLFILAALYFWYHDCEDQGNHTECRALNITSTEEAAKNTIKQEPVVFDGI